MADYAWSESECRPGFWWYGVPGSGTHAWTAEYGQFWVGGIIYNRWAQNGYECGWLGVPTSHYQWTYYGQYGQWFEGGCILANGWIVA